jgi:hypothetical protein
MSKNEFADALVDFSQDELVRQRFLDGIAPLVAAHPTLPASSETLPSAVSGCSAVTLDPHDTDDSPAPSDPLGLFPEDAWRGPFQTHREAMIGTSEAPDTAHFSALWGLAAATLRRRASFYYAYPHFPNVYLVNFGNTGDSKTSAARQGLRLLPDEGVKLLRGVGSAEALGDWMQQPEEGPMMSHLLFVEELATLLTRGGWERSTLLSFLTETFDAPDKYEIPFRKNPVLVQEPTPTLIAGPPSNGCGRDYERLTYTAALETAFST